MAAWQARIEDAPGGPRLRGCGASVAEVIARLEASERPKEVAEALGMTPAEWVAALACHAFGSSDGPGLPLVQARPIAPRLAPACREAGFADLFPGTSRPARLALSAGLCQIFDLWDESHEAAQQADDLGEREFSLYWHGIAHRREPDAGNASYWFRRVGSHPLFRPLADAAGPILAEVPSGRRAIRNGAWDPFGFIEFCGSARRGTPEEIAARTVQRIEMMLLLDATAASLTG